MQEPGNTEVQIHAVDGPERGLEANKEQEIRDYIKRTVEVAKERFFDTGQSATLALEKPSYVPGYVSLVAVTNPEQDIDVVIGQYNGLSADGGVAKEDIGGQEIHISYRQLKGSRSVPKLVRGKINGHDYGVMVLPSEGRKSHWINRPYSLKSTMRPVDVKKWDEGDTFPRASTGYSEGEKRLQPTKADYEAILDTVTRGVKNDALTRNSIQILPKITYVEKWTEKTLKDAQDDLDQRNQEIMRGERLAVESAEKTRLMLEQANSGEKDHANENSFEIGVQRLRELAKQVEGQDAMTVDYVASQLEAFEASINMVRTLLESDDPKVISAIKEVRVDKSEAKLEPSEMYELLAFIASHPEFEVMRKKAGFIPEAEYGISIDHMFTGEDKGNEDNQVSASQGTKMKILEALEFLRPGETLESRIDRISGSPMYGQTKTGEETGALAIFRSNPGTGESIVWNPYYAKTIHNYEKLSNVRIGSPLFGPHLIAMVDAELEIANDGQGDKLRPKTGKIDWVTFRFEGGADTHPEDVGAAMMRLSKKLKSPAGVGIEPAVLEEGRQV